MHAVQAQASTPITQANVTPAGITGALLASSKGLKVITSPDGIRAVRSFLNSNAKAQRFHINSTILYLKRGPAFWCGEFTPSPGQASYIPQGWSSVSVVLP